MAQIILPLFIEAGDIEGALERVNILVDLERKKQGNNSLMTLCLRAAIKNLNGDHEEWEAFEQKMISTSENIQKEKEATKRRKEQERAATIRERSILLPSKTNNKKGNEETKPQQHVNRTNKEMPNLSVDQEDSLNPLLAPLSLKKEKEEKKKRHEESEKQREAQRNQLTSLSIEEKKPQESISMTSQPSIQETPIPIKDLYSLTAIAKDVDAEIEGNTWMFSRENLMMYFEALGCVATDGGKHKKVSLPKALIVSYEGSIITIMNDLGGALTLPRWDGSEGNGQVPSYLRKQILEAREKLVLLKLKANKTINSNTMGGVPKK